MFATDVILLGAREPVQRGDEIPATYVDHLGEEQKVDFDRLVKLGVAVEEPPNDAPAGEELGEDLAAAVQRAEEAEKVVEELGVEVQALRERISEGEELGEDLGHERLLEIADWEGVDGVNGRTSKADLVKAIAAKRAAK